MKCFFSLSATHLSACEIIYFYVNFVRLNNREKISTRRYHSIIKIATFVYLLNKRADVAINAKLTTYNAKSAISFERALVWCKCTLHCGI